MTLLMGRRLTTDDWETLAGWAVIVALVVALVLACLACPGCRDLHIHVHLERQASCIQPADDIQTPEEILDEVLGDVSYSETSDEAPAEP